MIFKEEAPWITIAHSVRFDPIRKEVKGYKMDATAHHYFNRVDLAIARSVGRRAAALVSSPAPCAPTGVTSPGLSLPARRPVRTRTAACSPSSSAALALIVPTFIGVTLLAFALIHLIPGDPVENLSGERGMDPARRARLLHEFGLDRPLPRAVRRLRRPGAARRSRHVADHARAGAARIPDAVSRRRSSSRCSRCCSRSSSACRPAIVAALKRNTVADYAVMGVSLTGYSMPIFWWALLLILFFSVQLGWTPVSGRIAVQFDVPAATGFMLIDTLRAGDSGAFRSALSHLVLPDDRAGHDSAGGDRAHDALVDARGAARGLRAHRARQRPAALARGRLVHALRNALIPVITVIGLQVGLLLSGAILTETIFSWPGVGNWLVHGVQSRDYPVVQGGILLIAAIVISVNLIVDLLYGVINPRIRHG